MKADNTAFMKGRGNGGVKRAKVLPVGRNVNQEAKTRRPR